MKKNATDVGFAFIDDYITRTIDEKKVGCIRNLYGRSPAIH